MPGAGGPFDRLRVFSGCQRGSRDNRPPAAMALAKRRAPVAHGARPTIGMRRGYRRLPLVLAHGGLVGASKAREEREVKGKKQGWQTHRSAKVSTPDRKLDGITPRCLPRVGGVV